MSATSEQLLDVDIEPNETEAENRFTDDVAYFTESNITLFGKDLNITRSQLSTLILLSLYYILSASAYSLLAPFLPGEALKKNITQSQVGIIFGVFEFVLIILTPFFGKYLQVFGIRFLFLSGLFLTSGSEILFGFLDACPDGEIFFIMSVLCRVVTALGVSMGLSYAIVGHYFPNRISSIVALLEVFNGLGTMIGPVVGGFLFQLGGFRLPFFVTGGMLFVVFLLAVCFFPRPAPPESLQEATLPLLPLLKIPRLIFTILMLFVASLSIGFFQPSIEIHLKPLGLSPLQLGLILLCPALLYMCVTPPVGYICDKYHKTMPFFMLVGTIGSGISFCFFGPLSFLKLPLNLWIFLASFIAYGFFLAGLVIPVYAELVKIATLDGGYPNDIRMQGLISAIFGSSWSLGALLGPQIGGYGVDYIGFEKASLSIVACFFLSGLLYIGYFVIKWMCFSNRGQRLTVRELEYGDLDETNPLLN